VGEADAAVYDVDMHARPVALIKVRPVEGHVALVNAVKSSVGLAPVGVCAERLYARLRRGRLL
jgi:hypothetical protein